MLNVVTVVDRVYQFFRAHPKGRRSFEKEISGC